MDHHDRHWPKRCAHTGRKRHRPAPIADAEREKKYSFSTLHTLADKFVFVVHIESTSPRSQELRNNSRMSPGMGCQRSLALVVQMPQVDDLDAASLG